MLLTRNLARFTFGLMVGGIFLFLVLKNIKLEELKDEILNIKVEWVLLSFLLYWFELCLRISRWRFLLNYSGVNVSIKIVGISYLAGFAANNILPAKLGELFRADLFGRITKTPRLKALGTIILERLLDMIVILAMATWGILMLSSSSDVDHLSRLISITGSIILAIIVVILVTMRTRDSWGSSLLNKFRGRIQNLLDGLQLLSDTSSYFKLTSNSAIIWLLNSFTIWSMLMSLGINLNFDQALLLMGVIGISAAIPAAPAGIGTLQYAFYLVFLMLELPVSTGVVASVMVQLILLGTTSIIGGCLYYYVITTHFIMARK